jgi:hypothetical protein
MIDEVSGVTSPALDAEQLVIPLHDHHAAPCGEFCLCGIGGVLSSERALPQLSPDLHRLSRRDLGDRERARPWTCDSCTSIFGLNQVSFGASAFRRTPANREPLEFTSSEPLTRPFLQEIRGSGPDIFAWLARGHFWMKWDTKVVASNAERGKWERRGKWHRPWSRGGARDRYG